MELLNLLYTPRPSQSNLRYPAAVFNNGRNGQRQSPTIRLATRSSFDEPSEFHNPTTSYLPRRQQQYLPPSRRAPSSAGSDSVRSLRRTPRLQERRPTRPLPSSPPAAAAFSPQPEFGINPRPSRLQAPDVEIQFGRSGSTTPESFQRLVQTDSYWPRRSTHVSRRTHEAILFALEAIRTGNGVDAKPLTNDTLEEGARMSDLRTSNAPSGAVSTSRVQNGGVRPVQAAGGAATGQARFRTPTVVMAERRAREARKAEQEAAARRMQEEELRRQQAENVVGVGDDRRQTGGRAPLTEIQPGAAPVSTGVTISRRKPENIPATNGSIPRLTTTANPNQPRPINTQVPQAADQTSAGFIDKNRTEAFEKLSMPATAGSKPTQPQPTTNYPPPPTNTTAPPPQPQQSARTGFPHAFERWETLSSHWEGLTSYWIRKLESNTEELSSKPIDQQMARQITDLSAAGANLFHAVVELQRLRASSERKFQRWFFETRNDQEQAQERVAELERQLRHERENGSSTNATVEAAKAEKAKAEELVREMRRELQISKEEARRAWEELGRREQEERERTIALRSGEPTLIGGVQVVPMAGMSSRHASAASRPQTRGGPIPGGPGPTQMSGQQPAPTEAREAFSRSQTTLESADREQAQFTYQPGQTSPTGTDPFTDRSWTNEPQQPLRREPDTQFYSSPSRSQPQSSAVPATARSAASPSRGQTQSASPSRFHQGYTTSAASYQPTTTTAGSQRPVTAGSDNHSYIPSTTSGSGSAEEYHVNPDGTYTRDARGRRIPADQPILSPGIDTDPAGDQEGDDDEDDYTADVERERMYAQQYSQRQAASQPLRMTGDAPPTSPTVHHTTTLPSTTQTQASPGSRSYSSTISASSQPMVQPVGDISPDYEGAGYAPQGQRDTDIPENIVTGWEGIQAAPRHHHPSRLSAILEERSGRTSPSRGSYASETNPFPPSTRGGNNGNTAAQRSRFSPEGRT